MHSPESIHPAVQGCVHVLERCEILLDKISKSLYTAKDDRQDSIGAHVRHSLEHMTCFLEGFEAGVIDYDTRRRDEGIETEIDVAKNAVKGIRENLVVLTPEQLESSIQVKQIPGPRHPSVAIPSSVTRELLFLSSHTIHHLSVIYVHCNRAGLELPEDFPLAFSTIVYRNIAVG